MKLFSKSPFKLMFNVVMSMLLLSVGSTLAFAQDGARVYLQPVDSTDGRLTVDIIAENVANMYGAEVRLTYDPAVVSVQDTNPNQEGIQIEAGSLLPANKGFVVANQVNEAEGTIIFALTLLNPAPPANGSGPLARVTFNVLNPGPSSINIDKAKLVSIDLQTIPSQTTPLAIGNGELQLAEQQSVPQQNVEQQGTEQQSAPQQQQVEAASASVVNASPDATNSSNFPWWIIAVGIMVVGILGLGALVILSGLNKSSLQTNKPQSQQQRPQSQRSQTLLSQTTPQRVIEQQRPKHATGTRPSAFK